jgi:hypothetical protein
MLLGLGLYALLGNMELDGKKVLGCGGNGKKIFLLLLGRQTTCTAKKLG